MRSRSSFSPIFSLTASASQYSCSSGARGATLRWCDHVSFSRRRELSTAPATQISFWSVGMDTLKGDMACEMSSPQSLRPSP
jgi:hypothetical protein